MRSGLLSVISTISLVTITAQPVHARVKPPVFITRGAPVEPPRGFVAMCNTDKTFCATHSHDGAAAESSNAAAPFLPDGYIVNTSWQTDVTLFAAPGHGGHAPSACGALSFTPVKGGAETIASAHDELGELLARLKAAPSFAAVKTGAPPCTTHYEAPALTVFAQMPTAGLSAKPLWLAQQAGGGTTAPAPTERLKSDDSRRKAALLKEVNNLVNSRVRQRPDMEVYAEAEHWARSGIGPQAAGDCEDLAIEKRYQLLARGFDPANVSFAVVFSAATGLHTVLVARTDEGDMVLDSATPWIHRADQTGYSWISIQSADDQMTWVSAHV